MSIRKLVGNGRGRSDSVNPKKNTVSKRAIIGTPF